MKKMLKILTESIRQGLPHITSMDHKQFSGLMHKKHVDVSHMTEKTDGFSHKMGHDQHGFYTQSTGSGDEKMRKPEDYEERAKRRSKETGKPLDLTAAHAFGHIHKTLHDNKKLQSYLKDHAAKHGGETHVRGEVFYKPFGKPSEHHKGEVKFVGTSYATHHMGKTGKYVIHTKLPENQNHDHEKLKAAGDEHINFDDDKIHHGHKEHHVDVSHEHEAFKKLDHGLLSARKNKANAEMKEKEHAKMSHLQKKVSDKVDAHVKKLGLKPKWGSGSEGIVVHPGHEHAPRFKVTSDAFRAYKASDDSKNFKKRETVKESFSSFFGFAVALLSEGGNLKIDGAVAGPLHVKDRPKQQKEIHDTLSSIHDSFHKVHGEHLFGKDKKALHSGSAYAGSSKHFMNNHIHDDEFKKHKPQMGDVDAQIPHHLKDKVAEHLKKGDHHGPYEVVGVKKHGTEASALMKHRATGEHHQIDFEGVHYHHDEPSKEDQFLHSSSWEDTKHGAKGAHHKMLLNATGGEHHKFSITHGLRSRTDEKDEGTKDPHKVSKKLFGAKAEHEKVHSFHGVADLIKHHVPKEHHKAIYDKFVGDVSKNKRLDHTHAINHLKHHLGINESIVESVEHETEETHHTSVIPLVGFSPISHMGHAHDLGGALKKLPGKKHLGMSSKADAFTPEERKHILYKQWNHGQTTKHEPIKVHAAKSPGETVKQAWDSIAHHKGKKVLHLLVGHDRKDMAHKLKDSLHAGKVKEMGEHKFDEIHVHHPEDTDRSHGMSGTKMRQAAHDGNHEEFHRHVGPAFTKKESKHIMHKIKKGIEDGHIPLKR